MYYLYNGVNQFFSIKTTRFNNIFNPNLTVVYCTVAANLKVFDLKR